MRTLRLLAVLLSGLALPATLAAQPRPGAFTTVTLTNTSADALHVGCSVGSPACTGGIKAGPGTFSSLRVTGTDAIEIVSGVPGVTTAKLYNNSGNLYFNGVALATGASVSGTIGAIAKFTGASTVGDSALAESGGNVVASGTFGATHLTTSNTGATSIDIAGGITAGTGNVAIVDTTGKIPAISSTYFASLNGSTLTNVVAATLAAGTHTAAYVFNNVANVLSGVGTLLTALNASELTTGTVASARGGVPTGMVAYFNLGACPSGWTDVSSTYQGLYFTTKFAAQANGTVVGTALTIGESRAVGQHTHAITDTGHVHNISVFERDMDFGPGQLGDNIEAGLGDGTEQTASAVTGITINNAGSVAGTNAPYAVWLTCVKN
jgi:hypothetical protein